jgi:hypothetical protein
MSGIGKAGDEVSVGSLTVPNEKRVPKLRARQLFVNHRGGENANVMVRLYFPDGQLTYGLGQVTFSSVMPMHGELAPVFV